MEIRCGDCKWWKRTYEDHIDNMAMAFGECHEPERALISTVAAHWGTDCPCFERKE